jgi:hypothetical protein
MNRQQRDQNRENALRLSVVASEHALYPEYPNCVRKLTNQLLDNAALVSAPLIIKED